MEMTEYVTIQDMVRVASGMSIYLDHDDDELASIAQRWYWAGKLALGQMRSHDDPLASDECEPWFIDDMPNGDCLMQCGNCGAETTKVQCPSCSKIFVYRSWWSW